MALDTCVDFNTRPRCVKPDAYDISVTTNISLVDVGMNLTFFACVAAARTEQADRCRSSARCNTSQTGLDRATLWVFQGVALSTSYSGWLWLIVRQCQPSEFGFIVRRCQPSELSFIVRQCQPSELGFIVRQWQSSELGLVVRQCQPPELDFIVRQWQSSELSFIVRQWQ